MFGFSASFDPRAFALLLAVGAALVWLLAWALQA